MQWLTVQMLILYYHYKVYDSHTYKSNYRLLPIAKQDTVEQQMIK